MCSRSFGLLRWLHEHRPRTDGRIFQRKFEEQIRWRFHPRQQRPVHKHSEEKNLICFVSVSVCVRASNTTFPADYDGCNNMNKYPSITVWAWENNGKNEQIVNCQFLFNLSINNFNLKLLPSLLECFTAILRAVSSFKLDRVRSALWFNSSLVAWGWLPWAAYIKGVLEFYEQTQTQLY